MTGLVWSQLRRRGGRTVALLLAMLVAAGGFTVLTASSRASQLQTVGQVQAHARTAYDILVRPRGARLSLERTQGLIQPGFLTGIYGGITTEQWAIIRHLQGVQVAAPVAMLGYVVPSVPVLADTTAAMSPRRGSLARVDVSWSLDNGLSRERQQPTFVYAAPAALRPAGGAATGTAARCGTTTPEQTPPPPGTTVRTLAGRLACALAPADPSEQDRGGPAPGRVGALVNFPFPFVLAAVDPAEEARLDGIDQATVAGAPLPTGPGRSGEAVPVVVADRPSVQLQATISVSRLPARTAGLVQAGRSPLSVLAAAPATQVSRRSVTAEVAYHQLLGALSGANTKDPAYLGDVWQYWSVSPLTLSRVNGTLTPATVTNQLDRLWLDENVGQQVPAGVDDTQVRSLTVHRRYADQPLQDRPTPPAIQVRGRFEPSKLRGLGEVTAAILAGYATAPTEGADQGSRQLLGNRPLAPSSNVAGLVQPPPLMLTTLAALPQLTQGGWQPSTAAAPISAVRVRVAGVTGIDAVSRQRVRLAAQRITQATGLDVDVTVGSSSTRQRLTLPAGQLGRPQLRLSQFWVKLGVATAIVQAVDKKSLILFVLVLLVCGLSVANSTVASVRARRTELGVLACLGWGRRHLFGVVAAELAVVALAAGVAAAVLALAGGAVIGTPVSLPRAALAVPAALLIALVAGAVPAWAAARADPLEAVRPAVRAPRSARTPASVTGLGLVNLNRSRARAVVAASGLTLAVAAFTLLLAITLAFQGAVVGTLLGDAVAVQARGADYAATAATLLLAGLGVANVLYLNIRDRGAEIATLRAVGWGERHLSRLVVVEGLGIGLLGALPGAALGLAGAVYLARGITTPVVLAAVTAVLIGVGIAAAASAVPVRLLRRLPTAVLLTEE